MEMSTGSFSGFLPCKRMQTSLSWLLRITGNREQGEKGLIRSLNEGNPATSALLANPKICSWATWISICVSIAHNMDVIPKTALAMIQMTVSIRMPSGFGDGIHSGSSQTDPVPCRHCPSPCYQPFLCQRLILQVFAEQLGQPHWVRCFLSNSSAFCCWGLWQMPVAKLSPAPSPGQGPAALTCAGSGAPADSPHFGAQQQITTVVFSQYKYLN